MRSAKKTGSTHSAPLTKQATVKKKERPLVRIIHLDCGTGGDCSVLYTDSEFIVIDGGKGGTGTRLTALIKLLLEEGKTPLAFIVSHYDLDHFYGLFKAIESICIDPGTEAPPKKLVVLTPADVTIINRTGKVFPPDMEEGSKAFIECRDLRAHAKLYGITMDYSLPKHQSFKNGMKLELKSWPTQYRPSTCDENNASSLQWILRDSKETTQTTYYTGGDSESGPLAATIIKLDHHGSTVGTTNAKKAALKAASHWVIMGAGRVHKHPGLDLLQVAKANDPWILMTQHHFQDAFLDNDWLHVGRADSKWGDIGFALYKDEKILVNISEKKHLLTEDDDSEEVSSKVSMQLDKAMDTLLTSMREMDDCPDEKLALRTEKIKTVKVLKCVVSGCTEPASRVFVSKNSVDLIVCPTHKDKQLQLQRAQLKQKKSLNNKRSRFEDWSDDDEDEDDEEEDWSDEEEEPPEVKPRVRKKVKTEKNSTVTVQNVKKK